MAAFDPVHLGILWNRLISIVDEASIHFVRSSFSTAVREANDFACVLMAPNGDGVAQANISVPSFIGTVPSAVKHFLARFPPSSLQPGDVLICNDPWICNGHLPDVNMATPIFHRDRLVGFAGAGAHWPDMGGNQYSSDARSMFEEGLRIPVCKALEAGRENAVVLDFIAGNVHIPEIVLGDFRAQVAAVRNMAASVTRLLDEVEGLDFGLLSSEIQRLTEAEMRQAIADLPDGEYRGRVETDGYEEPLTITATIRIAGSELTVDFEGTSPQTQRGLNSVLNFTTAYTVYTLKCLLAPRTPNNQGSIRPIKVSAPLGSLLNPRFPAAVNGRTMTGHFIHAPILNALSPILPERVIAESGGCPIWGAMWAGTHRGRQFTNLYSANGGMGASQHRDGVSCMPFPSNVPNTPVEVTEASIPLLIEAKHLRQDSGGDGLQRGGLGQVVSVRVMADGPVTASLRCDRTRNPAAGLFDGGPGAPGTVIVNGEKVVYPKQKMNLANGDRLVLETPGGGGMGPAGDRSRDAVRRDLEYGYISPEKARSVYGLR